VGFVKGGWPGRQSSQIKMFLEQNLVREFMRTFQQSTPENPGMPAASIQHQRWKLCTEESKELGDATDLTAYLDAVLDLLYVVHGSAISAGFPIQVLEDGFKEVHRSNMSKFWSEDETRKLEGSDQFQVTKTESNRDKCYIVTRRSDGKVLKSPSYSPANLNQFLNRE
jgi:predicted HAD superfamily Cof-like phosphohydrolase